MKGFLVFLRQQGVVGLAVGFLLGGAVSKLVTSLVNDIVNPLLSFFLGFTDNLADASFSLGFITIRWGNFLNVFIDFLIISSVVYFGVKLLRLDKVDKKKE